MRAAASSLFRRLEDLTLRQRLVGSFLLMSLLTAAMGGSFIWSSWALRDKTLDAERQRAAAGALAETLHRFENLRRTVDGMILGSRDENGLELEREGLSLALARLDKEEAADVRSSFAAIEAGIVRVRDLLDKDRRREAAEMMESVLFSQMDRFRGDLNRLHGSKKDDADRSWRASRDLARKNTVFSLLLVFSAILSGAGLALALHRSVSRPLADLEERARALGSGDWQTELSVQGPPEVRSLGRTFQEMSRSLARLQSQVLQLDRVAAAGTLAAGVAHEINNPLTGILGQVQLALEELGPGDPKRERLEKIESAAQRCRRIVRLLLDFSRQKELAFESADAGGILDAALALCESQLTSQGIGVVQKRRKELPRIPASPSHLEQVFLNLIQNASQAMPRGGTLTLETAAVNEEGGLLLGMTVREISESYDDHFIQVSVTDTGEGIPRENIPKLFDPFFTTRPPGRGTGLGLTLSLGIVQAHRGRLLVRSGGPGKGASFSVRLPVERLAPDIKVTQSPFEDLEKRLDRFDERGLESGGV
ncbi:MAG: hypothetical protein A2902_01690 [Elusimicrobia bacterium RIFCSPLOWO2_01_FULL_64_13]|nr:MAG: hypothetical protein A2636_03910 [Elusimicrobia bacterium RIFCSPHIGHO2_01_FULL_64_10]OGR96742.1 MAG: hypothetical protein A2902_01690 [Elusimicrobia bacterium RIFCSPLOWO2_01_FULL_64_13]